MKNLVHHFCTAISKKMGRLHTMCAHLYIFLMGVETGAKLALETSYGLKPNISALKLWFYPDQELEPHMGLKKKILRTRFSLSI
ncbi:MAG: hypothetical protein ACKVOY_03315 [Burkholderiaceae bacterium]